MVSGNQTKRLIKEGKIKGFQKGEFNIAKREDIRKKISLGVSKSLIGNKRNLGNHHTNKTKEILRLKANEQWKNGMSKEIKEKISNKLKGRKLSKETILKYKNKIFSKEHRMNLSKSRKGMKFSEEHKNRLKEKRKYLILPHKDTSIEIKIQNFLEELNIQFLTHQYMEIEHGYQCDILIPSMNLVIECDGDYWHGNKEVFKELNEWQLNQIEEDKIRTNELEEAGFKILRLWERDINKMELNNFKDKLNKKLN